MRSFVKIKLSRFCDIILSFTDIGNHALFTIFYVANVSFNAIRENKILAKISEFTVLYIPTLSELCSETYYQINILKLIIYAWFCLFDLILYVPSTIFQLYRNGSSWVEPVLS